MIGKSIYYVRKSIAYCSPFGDVFGCPLWWLLGCFCICRKRITMLKKEAQYGLQRLNFWRRQAGLPVLERQAALEQAAQKHAQYLTHNPDGHDERNRSNPHFTGADPQERANADRLSSCRI